MKDEPIHLIHHSFYRQHGIFHSREPVHRLFPWNISWWRVLWRHYALATKPWTGSREHTAVNGSRESIHAVHEIWKSWMAWKIIHVNTPVNGFTWKSLQLFTAFHGLSRPVCSCESSVIFLCPGYIGCCIPVYSSVLAIIFLFPGYIDCCNPVYSSVEEKLVYTIFSWIQN